jgi:hypothetical protein
MKTLFRGSWLAALIALAPLYACQCDDVPGANDAGGGNNGDGVVDSGGGDPADAGPADSGAADSGLIDAGTMDAGRPDSGPSDSGNANIDAALFDAGNQVPADGGLLADAGAALADSGNSNADSGSGTPPDAGARPDGGAWPMPAECIGKGLCVVLRWQGTFNDVDLHLSRNDGDWCTDNACYFANCKEGVSDPVDWDSTLGFSAGDPRIVTDSMSTVFPEILVIDDPVVGDYTLGVYQHPPGASADATATVQVYSLDAEVYAVTRTFGPNRFWELGHIVITLSDLTMNATPRLCAQGDWICTDSVGACPLAP